METGNFSGLRNGNWKVYGVHSVKRKFFRFTWRKPENFRVPYILELSRNSGLRNKFPDHSISKMELFFRKNGNPTPSQNSFYHICHYLELEILTLGPTNFQNSTFGLMFFLLLSLHPLTELGNINCVYIYIVINIQQSTNLLR